MVRNYVRKTDRGKTSLQTYELAAEEILKGNSFKKAAAKFNISSISLHRFMKKKRAYDENKTTKPPNVGYVSNTILNEQEENTFAEYVSFCVSTNLEMKSKEARELGYRFAKKRDKKIPEQWSLNEMTGKAWIQFFMKRHPNLSLIPHGKISMKNSFTLFFDAYKSIIREYALEPQDIWNLVECGITTALNSDRVIDRPAELRVVSYIEADTGSLVMLALAGNAIGNYVPPMFMFPYKTFHDSFLADGPIGSVGVSNGSGWMYKVDFNFFLKHFKKHVRPSKDRKVLLLMENRGLHLDLDNIELCIENGIILLSLPTQCGKKLQPMNYFVSNFMKPSFNSACDCWMQSNPGKTISTENIPSITKIAFDQAITARNIIAGFKESEIWPVTLDNIGNQELTPHSAEYIECEVDVKSIQTDETIVKIEDTKPDLEELSVEYDPLKTEVFSEDVKPFTRE